MSSSLFCRYRAGVVVLLLSGVYTSAAKAEEVVNFDIPAQPAAKGLNLYAEQAGKQILFPYAAVEGVDTSEVVGVFDKDIALDALLSDTGLEAVRGENDTVTILLADTADGPAVGSSDSGKSLTTPKPMLMANASSSNNDSNASAAAGEERIAVPEDREGAVEERDEIIVTGSRLISDPGKLTRQITIFNRDEIERSGVTRLDEFLRRLPQNMNAPTNIGSGFNFGQSTPSFGLGNNVFAGSTINLRGLGAQYTLILIDGRRPARGGQFGEVVDISNIPIERVERIEVLFDGAAAIYGADAIGGVVNIITRRDFDGTDLSLTYSDTEDGGGARYNLQVGHTFNWGSGFLTARVSYQTQEQIDGSQRPNAAPVSSAVQSLGDFVLLPPSDNGNIRAFRRSLTEFSALFWVNGDERLSGGVEVPVLQQVWTGTEFELVETTTIVDRQSPRLLPGYFWIDEAAHRPQNPETLGFTPVYQANLPQYTGQPLGINDVGASNELGESSFVPFEGLALAPEDETYSIGLSFAQDFSEDISLNLNLDYTVADKLSHNLGNDTQGWNLLEDVASNPFLQPFQFSFQNVFPQQYQRGETTNYSASGNIDWDFSRDWSLAFGFGVSEQKQDSDTINHLRRMGVGPDNLNARLNGYYTAIDPISGNASREFIDTHFNDPLLGYGSIEEMTAALVVPFMHTSTDARQYDMDLRLFGKLFELPAGDVRTSFSVKYREDKTEIFDNNPLIGDDVRSRALDSRGVYDYDDSFGENVKSLGGELSVPVFGADFKLPLVEHFLLSLSGSVEEYSNTDDNGFNWAAGFNWGLNEQFIVRLNRTHSLRVPESVRTARERRWSVQNTFPVYNDVNDQFPVQVDGTLWRIFGGADHLKPERNDGVELSFIYRPAFAEGLDIQLSFSEKHTVDQLGNPFMGRWTFDTLLPESVRANPLFDYGDPENNAFHASAVAELGGVAVQMAPGELIFDAREYNIGDTFSRGADLQVSYAVETGFGDWLLTWRHQYFDTHEVTRSNVCAQVEQGCSHVGATFGRLDGFDEPIDIVGSVSRDNYRAEYPLPRNQGSIDLFWGYRGLGVNLATRYESTTSIFKTQDIFESVIVGYIEFGDLRFPITESRLAGTNIYREDTTAERPLDLTVSYDFGRGGLFDAPRWLGDARISLAVRNLYVRDRRQTTTVVQEETEDPIGVAEDINIFAINPRGKSYALRFSTTF